METLIWLDILAFVLFIAFFVELRHLKTFSSDECEICTVKIEDRRGSSSRYSSELLGLVTYSVDGTDYNKWVRGVPGISDTVEICYLRDKPTKVAVRIEDADEKINKAKLRVLVTGGISLAMAVIIALWYVL